MHKMNLIDLVSKINDVDEDLITRLICLIRMEEKLLQIPVHYLTRSRGFVIREQY
jgi:hypothetical protein